VEAGIVVARFSGEGRSVAFPRTLRGNINAILNPMIRDGAIAGFSTNLSSKPPSGQPVIRIFPKEGDDPARVEREVREALAGLGASLDVRIGLLADLQEVEEEP
jgi:hypothetical protein